MKTAYLWGAYLKSRIKVIAAFVLFMLVFALVYALYHLPLEPVVYSAELVTALAVIFAGWDFWHFYQKHQRLTAAINAVTAGLGELPKPRDLLESDYQTLIRVLAENRAELISQFDNRQTDMIDYYTLWAHQIKTPISAMGLLLQTEESDRERTRAYGQELFKIEQYVEMVLQYLRLESMSSDLILVEYDLADIVRQAVKKYGIIFINKKISLELAELNCRVLTDEKWLVFVLGQVISNALKYTNQGKISIYLDQQAVAVRVSDHAQALVREQALLLAGQQGLDHRRHPRHGNRVVARAVLAIHHIGVEHLNDGKGLSAHPQLRPLPVHQLSQTQHLVDVIRRAGDRKRACSAFTQRIARRIEAGAPHEVTQPVDGDMPQGHRRALGFTRVIDIQRLPVAVPDQPLLKCNRLQGLLRRIKIQCCAEAFACNFATDNDGQPKWHRQRSEHGMQALVLRLVKLAPGQRTNQ